jgi:hypothetical protein
MSTDDDYEDIYAVPQTPSRIQTNELRLTQLDDKSDQIIRNILYIYQMRETQNGSILTITGVKYPPLEKAYSYAGSHLNNVMYYRWTQAQAEIMFFEGLFYDPLSLYYNDDPEALQCLDAIYLMFRRAIKGGAIDGSHQDYNIKMSHGYNNPLPEAV